ncbi:MAG TPA: phosphoribosylformylglycinamidine synthase subunit PurQ [Chloroflexia bacterium]|nr:phosphoribosylformylglycinamidine synthase subunit PurQ [Chloroflexia bacterium]
MRVGVAIFPGSNGDHDALYALGETLGQDAEPVWHTERDVSRYDLVVLPGGFSYGDYLRCGAIARFTPVMDAIRRYAEAGGWVLGICNGFQVLAEAHLLPGALIRNDSRAFSCRYVHTRLESSTCALLNGIPEGTVWRLPIAHGEGRYYADTATLEKLHNNRQIVLTYTNAEGKPEPGANPNGSSHDIAGICNAVGNVLGLMPHPERAAEALLGEDDGADFLRGVIHAWQASQSSSVSRRLSAV